MRTCFAHATISEMALIYFAKEVLKLSLCIFCISADRALQSCSARFFNVLKSALPQNRVHLSAKKYSELFNWKACFGGQMRQSFNSRGYACPENLCWLLKSPWFCVFQPQTQPLWPPLEVPGPLGHCTSCYHPCSPWKGQGHEGAIRELQGE